MAQTHLAQAFVLLQRPHHHLVCPRRSKHASRHRLHRHREKDPAKDLDGVVGARDAVEQEAARNLVSRLAGRAESCKDEVAPDTSGDEGTRYTWCLSSGWHVTSCKNMQQCRSLAVRLPPRRWPSQDRTQFIRATAFAYRRCSVCVQPTGDQGSEGRSLQTQFGCCTKL